MSSWERIQHCMSSALCHASYFCFSRFLGSKSRNFLRNAPTSAARETPPNPSTPPQPKKKLIRFSLAHSVLGTHWHGVEPGQRCGRLVYNVVIHGLEGWRVWIPSKRLSMCKLRTLCKSFIICPIYKSLIIGHGRSRGNQWYFLWYVGVIEDWN